MNQPTTIRCPTHGEVQFTGSSDLGGEIVTLYCPICAKEMQNTVWRTCDECGNCFEVREDIANEMDAWAAQGEPYVCGDCMPDDPYADDEPSDELEDSVDAMAERFPDGADPLMHDFIEAKCGRCDVEFEVRAGEVAWCPACHGKE